MKKLDVRDMEEFGRLREIDRYPRRWMVAADGETERG